MNFEVIHTNLSKLRLITSDNKPLLYSAFKKFASVHKYGNKYKIVFVGIPNDNLFGFYVDWGNDTDVMKQAYKMYVRLVNGNMDEFNDKEVQWGNCGIPIKYGNLRKSIESIANE